MSNNLASAEVRAATPSERLTEDYIRQHLFTLAHGFHARVLGAFDYGAKLPKSSKTAEAVTFATDLTDFDAYLDSLERDVPGLNRGEYQITTHVHTKGKTVLRVSVEVQPEGRYGRPELLSFPLEDYVEYLWCLRTERKLA